MPGISIREICSEGGDFSGISVKVLVILRFRVGYFTRLCVGSYGDLLAILTDFVIRVDVANFEARVITVRVLDPFRSRSEL